MKRIFKTGLGILLAAAMAAGCGRDGFVKEKQHETLKETLQAPEDWEEGPFFSGDGRMQVEADARVQVPDAQSLPVWKIERVCMDQALAEQIVRGLFGEAVIYNPYYYLGLADADTFPEQEQGFSIETKELGGGDVMTTYRGVVEQNGLVYWCELTSGLQNGTKARIYAQRENSREERGRWQWYGAESHKIYEEAGGPEIFDEFTDPEEGILYSIMEGELPDIPQEELERLAGLTPEEAEERADKYVEAMGLGEFEAVSVAPVGGYLLGSAPADGEEAQSTEERQEAQGTEEKSETQRTGEQTGTAAKERNEEEGKAAEEQEPGEQDGAAAKAQGTEERVQQGGAEAAASGGAQDAAGVDWTAALGTGAYQIVYTRTVEGIPVTYERSRGGNLPEREEGNGGGAVVWPYERLWLIINGDGVQYLELNDLYRVEREQSERTELLEFSQIREIVKSAVEEGFWITKGDGGGKSVIREARLGYMKLYDPWAEEVSGVLVPVWDFFGWQELDGSGVFCQKYVSYLTVQAADGRVLDRTEGCLWKAEGEE